MHAFYSTPTMCLGAKAAAAKQLPLPPKTKHSTTQDTHAMHYVTSQDGRVHAFYSTPSKYLDAKSSNAKQLQLPLKTDDFFPYSDNEHSFWTGVCGGVHVCVRRSRV